MYQRVLFVLYYYVVWSYNIMNTLLRTCGAYISLCIMLNYEHILLMVQWFSGLYFTPCFAGDMHYFYLMQFYTYNTHTYIYIIQHGAHIHVCRCTRRRTFPQVVVRKCLSIAAVCVTTVDLDGATTI